MVYPIKKFFPKTFNWDRLDVPKVLQVQLTATWDVCEVRQGSPFKEAVAVFNFLDWIAKTLIYIWTKKPERGEKEYKSL